MEEFNQSINELFICQCDSIEHQLVKSDADKLQKIVEEVEGNAVLVTDDLILTISVNSLIFMPESDFSSSYTKFSSDHS